MREQRLQLSQLEHSDLQSLQIWDWQSTSRVTLLTCREMYCMYCMYCMYRCTVQKN